MEVEKSKVKVLANSVLVRVSSRFVDSWLLAVSPHGLSCVCIQKQRERDRGREAACSDDSSYKGTNPSR